jgi:poly-gamma-glutamate capsule biosynthesis protein CapA/YwtB (metallophosphatase superfamily)
VEFYNGGVIVYGLGNFAFTITGPPESVILNVWLDRDGVHQIEFVPVVLQASGQPRPATAEEAKLIRQQVYDLTNLLNGH